MTFENFLNENTRYTDTTVRKRIKFSSSFLLSLSRENWKKVGINLESRESLSGGGPPGNAGSRIQFGFPRNRRDVIQFPRLPLPPPRKGEFLFRSYWRSDEFSRVFAGLSATRSRLHFRHVDGPSTLAPSSQTFPFRAYVREILHPFSLSLSLPSPPSFFPFFS